MRAIVVAIAIMFAACKHEPQTHRVAIRGMHFVPETVEVAVGDTVVWTNEDIVPHNITAEGTFTSESLASRQEFRYTATRVDDFHYTCTFHPMMKGTLEVR